jgi:arylsulfatase A-like enzyme
VFRTLVARCIVVAGLAIAAHPAKAATKPNIVYIISDDLGWKDVGFHGSDIPPRRRIVYNVEPFRAAIREGDWKLIWRTPLPAALELYNLKDDPSEKTDVAAEHPDKVAEAAEARPGDRQAE